MIEFILSKVKDSGMPFPISYLARKVADKISQAYEVVKLRTSSTLWRVKFPKITATWLMGS